MNEISITVNARGQIKGDISNIPPETLEQLSTPEAAGQMRKMYKEHFDTGRRRSRIQLRMVNDGEQRDFSGLRPQGMSAKDFRRLRKQQFRKWTKDAIRQQRRLNHGGN